MLLEEPSYRISLSQTTDCIFLRYKRLDAMNQLRHMLLLLQTTAQGVIAP